MQKQIIQNNIEQMRSDRLRYVSELGAGLAHELNQPLSGISMFAENILYCLQENLPLEQEEITHAMSRILEQVERISSLIEHVRDFSRDANRQERLDANLYSVVESAVSLFKAQFAGHGIDFSLADNTNGQCIVCCNPFAMEEAVLNLLTNARDALDLRDGGDKRIRVLIDRDETSDGRVMLTIEDSGDGIPPEDLEKVFDPFYTTKGPDKGVGLGLPVAKSIVEREEGHFQLFSTQHQGTIVKIGLPVIN